jgi:hypothetical protein
VNPAEILNLIKGIILNPDREWKIIKTFNYSWKQVYFYFTIPMAFLSAFAILFFTGVDIKVLNLTPNTIFIINILGSLGSIALGAYLISKMAPRFEALSSFNSTTALISFSYTPIFLSNIIASIHPVFAVVNFIGIFYMVIVFWKGLAILLDTPAYKLMGFTIVNLIILFATRLVITTIVAAIVLSFTGGVESVAR